MVERIHSEQSIQELLPFYANGTLGEDEQRLVKEALESDSELQGELHFLLVLRSSVKVNQPEWTPSKFGLTRLQREIVRQEKNYSLRNVLGWSGAIAAGLLALWITILEVITVADQDPDFKLAGTNGQSAIAEQTFLVSFSEIATESEIRSLLHGLDLRILDGPSAIGLYTIGCEINVDPAVIMSQLEAAPVVTAVQEN